MSDSMVETVARAICKLDCAGHAEYCAPCTGWDHPIYLDYARAAIEAMREPSQEMRLAGIQALSDNSPPVAVLPIYRAMITAALDTQAVGQE